MKNKLFISLTLAGLLFSCSCMFTAGSFSEVSWDEIEEDFDEADEPTLTTYTYDDDGTDRTYRLMEPWNYDKDYNSSREYPIVVSLHGSTSSTTAYYSPCIVGDTEEKQDYPCFFLAPSSSSGWGSSAAWIRTLMSELQETYRIDTNRIYVIGFSMGGSGSYIFTNYYESEQGGYVAGIVRLAGASQTSFDTDEITDRIAVWYHAGLDDSYDGGETNDSDDTDRISVQAFNNMWDYWGDALSYDDTGMSSGDDTINGYNYRIQILEMDDIEVFKLTHYEDMGHDSSTAWEDPDVLEWLFDQSLENR
jgi:predicted peptidase